MPGTKRFRCEIRFLAVMVCLHLFPCSPHTGDCLSLGIKNGQTPFTFESDVMSKIPLYLYNVTEERDITLYVFKSGQRQDVCKLVLTRADCNTHTAKCQCSMEAGESQNEYNVERKFSLQDGGDWVFEVWNSNVSSTVRIIVQDQETSSPALKSTATMKNSTPGQKYSASDNERSTLSKVPSTPSQESISLHQGGITSEYENNSSGFVTFPSASQRTSAALSSAGVITINSDTFVIISIGNGVFCILLISAIALTIAIRRHTHRKRSSLKNDLGDMLPYADGNTEIEERPLPLSSKRKGRQSLARRAYDAVVSVRYERPFQSIVSSFRQSHRSDHNRNPYDKQFQGKRVSTTGVKQDGPTVYANCHVTPQENPYDDELFSDGSEPSPPLPEKTLSKSTLREPIYQNPTTLNPQATLPAPSRPQLPPVSARQPKPSTDYSSC